MDASSARRPERPASLRAPLGSRGGRLLAALALLGLASMGIERLGVRFAPFDAAEWMGQVAVVGLLAVGASMVVTAGRVDLSQGAVAAFAPAIAAWVLTVWPHAAGTGGPTTIAAAAAVLAALGVGLAVGLWNAAWVERIAAPSALATLATAATLAGLANVVCPWEAVAVGPFGLLEETSRRPAALLGFAGLVALVGSFVMGATTIGRHLHAAGNNEEAARICGLPLGRLRCLVFVVSGVLAATGGLAAAGCDAWDAPPSQSLVLIALAAAMLGGGRVPGGRGSIIMTALATVLSVTVLDVVQRGVTGGTGTAVPDGLLGGAWLLVGLALNRRDGRRE